MKCPACHRRRLRHVEDRFSRAAVEADGRYLLRCEACGEVHIVNRGTLRALKGIAVRPGLLWWIGAAVGILLTITEALVRWAVADAAGPAAPFLTQFVLAWVILGLLRIILLQLRALKDSRDARRRFELAFGTLLLITMTVFMAWISARIYLDYRADRRRFTPPPPTSKSAARTGLGLACRRADDILPACQKC